MDVANDPIAVYDALTELDPPRIDFLLPHATWDAPPVRPNGSPTVYADWLLTVFDRWDTLGRRVPVRLFESVLSTLAGGPSLTESLGLAPTDLVVVETDGALEQVDSLKSAYEGAAATGFDVFHHSFDEVAAHPGVKARQRELAGVSETCRQCPVVRSCGGGLYTHRYSEATDFDNTSVYCSDLEALIRGIERRVADELVPAALTEPSALLAEDQDLTRALLVSLHGELAGRGGTRWDRGWELTLALDAQGDPLDSLWRHPYTRTWLQDTHRALAGKRPDAVERALRLPSYLAAALVAAGSPTPVRTPYEEGVLRLPGLGELRMGEPSASGEAEVEATGDGFVVRAHGRTRQVRLTSTRRTEDDDWRPVRTLGGTQGVPLLRLDDLDPYRDCFAAPTADRLTSAEVERWNGLLSEAWALLRQFAAEEAAEAAGWLTTLTPLTSSPPGATETPAAPSLFGRSSTRERALRGHGYGALGIAPARNPEQLAVELLRGFRRAKLNALLEVGDLYAQDGWWRYPAPWRSEEVPVSELLAGVWERAGLAAFDPEGADQAKRGLATLERAAELTVSGHRLLAQLRRELATDPGPLPRQGSDGPGDGRPGQGGGSDGAARWAPLAPSPPHLRSQPQQSAPSTGCRASADSPGSVARNASCDG